MKERDVQQYVLGGTAREFHSSNSAVNSLFDECLTSLTSYPQWQRSSYIYTASLPNSLQALRMLLAR